MVESEPGQGEEHRGAEGGAQGESPEVESLRNDLAALKEKAEEADKVRQALSEAVGKYRLAVLAGAHGIPEEMVQGESVEEIDASLAAARGLVARIRQQLEAEAAGKKVPAGAPPRTSPDLSALSPAGKIAFGLRS